MRKENREVSKEYKRKVFEGYVDKFEFCFKGKEILLKGCKVRKGGRGF